MIQVSPHISQTQTVPPTDGTTDHGKQLYRPRFPVETVLSLPLALSISALDCLLLCQHRPTLRI